MSAFIRFALLLSLFSANLAFASTLKVGVNGMVCAFCAQGIEKKVRALPQTKDVYVNLKKKVVAIEIKDGQTLSESTVKDLIKEAGYDVSSISLLPDNLAQVRAQIMKEEAPQ